MIVILVANDRCENSERSYRTDARREETVVSNTTRAMPGLRVAF
jgi:hypothetical protein